MKCSSCGSELRGKFCAECGTSAEPTNYQQSQNEPEKRAFKKIYWLIPTIVLVVTAGLVLWQFLIANSAASSYQEMQKKLPQAEQLYRDAKEASSDASMELQAVLACNDYFGSDCSWALGSSLSQLQSDATAAEQKVASAKTSVDELNQSASAAKKQVTSSNQAMLMIAVIGFALTVLGFIALFMLKRRSEQKKHHISEE